LRASGDAEKVSLLRKMYHSVTHFIGSSKIDQYIDKEKFFFQFPMGIVYYFKRD